MDEAMDSRSHCRCRGFHGFPLVRVDAKVILVFMVIDFDADVAEREHTVN